MATDNENTKNNKQNNTQRPSRRQIIEHNQQRKLSLIENNISAEVFIPESQSLLRTFRHFRMLDPIDASLRAFWGDKITSNDMEKWLKLVDEIHQKVVEAQEFGMNLLIENGRTRGIENFLLRQEVRRGIEKKEKETKEEVKEKAS